MLGKSVPKKHLFLDVVTEEEYHVFGSLDEMLDADVEGTYTADFLDLGTPWPVGQNPGFDFDSEVTYVNTYWYYKPNEKYNEWISAVEAKNRARLLRRVAKGRYKQLVRTIEKLRRKAVSNEATRNIKFNFLNLVLMATSILGWEGATGLEVLFGLVNLGFCMGFS